MKIFVFGTRGFPNIQGGVEKHCEALYDKLCDLNQITVFRRKPYVKDDKLKSSIGFIDLPSTKIKGFEALIHSFLCTCICIQKRPDIIHIHNIGPGLFIPLLRLLGLKVVLTYHSPNYEHSKWGFVSKKILKLSEFIALSGSNKIIFVNRFQLDKQKDVIKQKSYYIPNGISKTEIDYNSDLLRKYDLSVNEYILGVGRITPEKGFIDLIKAYRELDDNKYKLVIAGGVEHESSYFELLKKSSDKNVVFTGSLSSSELAVLYSNARLFVLSSHNEGFPLVVLEAMSHGCDMLLNSIPATQLLDLPNDYYYKKNNIHSLSNEINNRIKRSFRKHTYNLTEYDWDIIAQQTKKVYESIY